MTEAKIEGTEYTTDGDARVGALPYLISQAKKDCGASEEDPYILAAAYHMAATQSWLRAHPDDLRALPCIHIFYDGTWAFLLLSHSSSSNSVCRAFFRIHGIHADRGVQRERSGTHPPTALSLNGYQLADPLCEDVWSVEELRHCLEGILRTHHAPVISGHPLPVDHAVRYNCSAN